jgi:hypothetical protein
MVFLILKPKSIEKYEFVFQQDPGPAFQENIPEGEWEG